MKWSALAGVVLFAVLAVASPQAEAILLEFTPGFQVVGVGDTVYVEVVISHLGEYEPPSLGAFDFFLVFDPAVLRLSGVKFTDPILGDQLDLSGEGSEYFDVWHEKGVVELFGISYNSAKILDGKQAGAFTLATLGFDALALGVSPLDFKEGSKFFLSDAWGDPLKDVKLASASVSVVPEPATLLLLGTGLVGLGIGARRRRR